MQAIDCDKLIRILAKNQYEISSIDVAYLNYCFGYLQGRLHTLEKALKFYADKKHYSQSGDSVFVEDGEVARNALTELVTT